MREMDLEVVYVTASFIFAKGENEMLENTFKTDLIDELENMFPGCMVFHLDPSECQGIPDLIVLYKDKWAALEGKKSARARLRPNQDYYVNLMNEMSFASFIFPENKDYVLERLHLYFEG